jgi:NAD+ kinase
LQIACVGICLNPDRPAAPGAARGLAKWLAERGLRVLLDDDAAQAVGAPATPRDALMRSADLVVVLGGDGTLLSVARDAGERPVPIAGINLGTLGFMAEIALDEMYAALERILAGEARVESRMRLEVVALRGERALGRWLALNDAVVDSAETARLIELDVRVDDMDVTTYRADGLLLSTPTGSTAYSLSAGGPILLPGIDAFVITPICPHTLTQRPVVLPRTSRVEMHVFPRQGEAQLNVDGRAICALGRGDRVTVRGSEHPAHFVVSPQRSRFDVLRAKLRWGTD